MLNQSGSVDGSVGRGLLLQKTWRASQNPQEGGKTFRNGSGPSRAAVPDFDLSICQVACLLKQKSGSLRNQIKARAESAEVQRTAREQLLASWWTSPETHKGSLHLDPSSAQLLMPAQEREALGARRGAGATQAGTEPPLRPARK